MAIDKRKDSVLSIIIFKTGLIFYNLNQLAINYLYINDFYAHQYKQLHLQIQQIQLKKMEENKLGTGYITGDPIISFQPFCPAKNIVNLICHTQGCTDNALICNIYQCEYCKIKHSKCPKKIRVKQFLKTIQQQRRQAPANIKAIFEDVIKHYDDVIEKISLDRIQFIEFTKRFGLSQNALKTISMLNEENESQITGELIHQLFLQNESSGAYSPSKMRNQQQIIDYQIQIKTLLNKLSFQLAENKKEMALMKFGQQSIEQKQLQARYKHWEFIPLQVSSFEQAIFLNLSSNRIRIIDNLWTLPLLQELYLNNNNIIQIQGLEKLTNMKNLTLNENQITQIKNLDKLVKLKLLFLSMNPINKIENLEALVDLQNLELNNCNISKLESIDHLVKLKRFQIHSNPLVEKTQEKQKIKEMRNKGMCVIDQDYE